jgi:hypothetical protein
VAAAAREAGAGGDGPRGGAAEGLRGQTPEPPRVPPATGIVPRLPAWEERGWRDQDGW